MKSLLIGLMILSSYASFAMEVFEKEFSAYYSQATKHEALAEYEVVSVVKFDCTDRVWGSPDLSDNKFMGYLLFNVKDEFEIDHSKGIAIYPSMCVRAKALENSGHTLIGVEATTADGVPSSYGTYSNQSNNG